MPEGKCFFPFRGKNELFGFFLKYESLIDGDKWKEKETSLVARYWEIRPDRHE